MKSKRFFAIALLGTSALMLPSVAFGATPAPRFSTPDDHHVDLTSGLVWFAMEEGGIGSGEGRVSMQRYYAADARWVDNWSGGLYFVTSGGVTKAYARFGGISDTFTGSGTSWASDKGDGSKLEISASGQPTYTGRDGTKIVFIEPPAVATGIATLYGTPEACPGEDPGTCHVPISITRPNGLKFTLSYGTAQYCAVQPPGEPCQERRYYHRLANVVSSAANKLTISYAGDVPFGTPPTLDWYKRTSVTFTNTANPPSPLPTVSYAYGTNTIEVTDPGSRTWRFTTNSNGLLSGIRRPGSASDNISYTYGPAYTVTSATKDGVTNSYSRSVSGSTATMTVTDPLSNSVVVTSDLTIGRPTSHRNELLKTASYQYDSNGRLARITAPESNYTEYQYDARGNVTKVTQAPKPGSALAPIVTTATYAASCANVFTCNKPEKTTNARNATTDYTFSPTHGGLVTVKLPAASSGGTRPLTTYAYTGVPSATGDTVSMPSRVYACQTTASCNGTVDAAEVRAEYNSNLLPTSVTRRNGTGTLSATTTIAYDARGNMTTMDGPLGADTWAYKYDAADQLVGTILPDPDGAGSLRNRAAKLTYRPDGQVSKQQLGTTQGQSDNAWNGFASLQAVDVSFDTNSRPVTVKLSGGTTAYALTQMNYDALGRVNCTAVRMNSAVYGSLPSSACTLSTQGSFGPDRVRQVVYDAASQVTQLKVAVGTVDAATERTLTYSSNGLVATLKDGENNRTTFVYNALDRLTRVRFPVPTQGANTSSTTDFEEYTYDPNANVTQVRTRAAQTISYSYDNLDRIVHKGSSVLADVDYTYDLLGRLLTAKFSSSPQEGITNDYDALGRLVSSSSNLGGTAHPLTYQYDLADRGTRVTWWDGLYVSYDRRVTGEIEYVRENGVASGAGVLASIAYDDLGRRTTLVRGNGTSTSWQWDPVSRLQSMTHNLAGTASDLTQTFAYNPANQIAGVTRSNDSYAWSPAGSGSDAYVNNGLNQIATIDGVAASHDANGNLTADPDSGRTFAYDAENRMTFADPGAPGQVPMRYDPLGRFDLYDPGSARRFVQDSASATGAEPVAELTSGGSMIARYVRGDAPDELIAFYSGSGTTSRRWAYQDERGSIVAEADGTGAATQINRYDEYGVPASGNAGRFGYTGQMWLPEAGLFQYKHRMYAPRLGRFVQPDPIGYEGGMNLYAYVGNDPVNYVDPLGLEAEVPHGDIIVIYCQNGGMAAPVGLGMYVCIPPLRDIGFGGGGDGGQGEVGGGGSQGGADQQNRLPCTPTPAQLAQSGKVTFKFAEGGWSGGAFAAHVEGTFTTSGGYSGWFTAKALGLFFGVRGPGVGIGFGRSESLATFAGSSYNIGGILGPYSISDSFDPNLRHVGQTDAAATPGLGIGGFVASTKLRNVMCPK